VILSREKTRSATLFEVSKQGIAPSHILAIGDSSNDDRGARGLPGTPQCLMVTTTARLYKRFKVMV
jgi:hypothetical protein